MLLGILTVLILPSPGLAEDYRITPGDELEIFIWNNPDLSRSLEVMMDGSISMPLIGRVRAENLTSSELEERIASELSDYIKHPGVSVIISRYSRWIVTIFGEVHSPGGRREFGFYDGMGMLELVARAGGFTRDARLAKSVILRKKDGGNRERIEVNLKTILDGRSPDVMLQMGDVVYVPHSGLSAWNYFLRNIMPTLSFIATMVTMSALVF